MLSDFIPIILYEHPCTFLLEVSPPGLSHVDYGICPEQEVLLLKLKNLNKLLDFVALCP